jgi:hypothetical protein
MQRGFFHRKVLNPGDVDIEPETTPMASRHRRKRMPPKPAEIISICYEAIVEKQLHKDIAMRHNMTISSVSRHASKAKKNHRFMEELY